MNTNPTVIGTAFLSAIAATKATKQKASNQQIKQKVSRRILPARITENITVVCDATGCVSLIDIPLIPTHTLIWTSPLASLPNCRGLVQQGFTYLERLDTQVLAALLITIADSYSLLRYSPTDTGAQKNAILRTAGKLVLINALLLIEEYVHSHNRIYLPALSLLFDTKIEQNGIETRMTEWMKEVASVLLRLTPADNTEESQEDSFYSTAPKKTITPDFIRDKKASKARAAKAAKATDWAETNKKWAEQRVYKEDIKNAKVHLKNLIMVEQVSPKLQGLLKSVFTEDSLLSMDSSMRSLLSLKMSSFSSESAKALIVIIDKDYPLLRSEYSSLSLDDNEELPAISSEPLPCSVVDQPKETEEIGEATDTLPASIPSSALSPSIETIAPIASSIPAKRLTFTEILLAKKLAAQNKA